MVNLLDLYNEIVEFFKNYPEVLYGLSDIKFSGYSSRYRGALIFAVPHSKMLTLQTYEEELFEALIMEARNQDNLMQKELETILQNSNCKYEIPPVAQTSEDTFVAPLSFKYTAVNAHLGWI